MEVFIDQLISQVEIPELPIVRVRIFVVLNFHVLGETASMLNFRRYKFSQV